MRKINWIIDGYRYWDKTNGNSYYLTRLTHCNTGNSIVFDECEGNVRSKLSKVQHGNNGNYHYQLHVSPIQDISYREWRRQLNSEYHMPVSVYEHKNYKVTNVSTKLIRQLTRRVQ